MLDEAKKERLAEVRKLAAEREQAARDAADLLELEAEELHLKQSGTRGVDFEIIKNRFGCFAVKKPDDRAIAAWDRQTPEKKLETDWIITWLRHYILPDAAEGVRWAQIAAQRPGLAWETANAFLALMGVSRDEAAKK
jgi:hypothetical protein